MTVQTLLSRLDRVKPTGRGQWVACCPSHDSKSRQSLAIRETDDGTILIHDFGGCAPLEVLGAVGMDLKDLFNMDGATGGGNHSKPQRMPFSYADALRCVSFEALLAATAACNLANGIPLTHTDRARLLQASRRIHHALEVCQWR